MKRFFRKYANNIMNCFAWFVAGLMVLIKGNIDRFEYFLIWISLVMILWVNEPVKWFDKKELESE